MSERLASIVPTLLKFNNNLGIILGSRPNKIKNFEAQQKLGILIEKAYICSILVASILCKKGTYTLQKIINVRDYT